MLECQRCEYGDGDKENEYILPLLNKNFYFFLFQRYVGLQEYILNVECSIHVGCTIILVLSWLAKTSIYDNFTEEPDDKSCDFSVNCLKIP